MEGTQLSNGTLLVEMKLLGAQDGQRLLARPGDVQVSVPSREPPTLNPHLHPSERQRLLRDADVVADLQPHLDLAAVQTQGGWDSDYNCIANSVASTSERLWPEDNTLAGWDALYARHGFVRANETGLGPADWALQDGLEKTLLFGHESTERGFHGAHAIRQEEDGSWSSKNGSAERIRVTDPRQLGGGGYGEPTYLYVRARR